MQIAEIPLVQGKTGLWEVVIGVEVHAQVVSESKLFSGASTAFGGEPNSQVSLVDAAMPGMLPVPNAVCIRQAVRTGLGLHAEINLFSVFDRKNYFYADLPQGYQISQFHHPIVGKGEIVVDLPQQRVRKVGITRIHLEQDAGKSLHDQNPKWSFIDLNRSGIALMEIVSEPDIRSAEEAGAYVKKLRTILRYLGTCDGNMEQGSLRADINVSVRRPGEEFGTRCEIKNVNSIKFIQQAVDYEVLRQVDLIESGGKVDQETRLFDPQLGQTRSMRSKEFAHDYRYFPDPDLLPIVLDQHFIDEINRELPELPDAKKQRFMEQYGLSTYDAEVLVAEQNIAAFFETVIHGPSGVRDGKVVANWITGSVFAAMNRDGINIDQLPITAVQIGQLLDCLDSGTLSGRLAKEVFDVMWETGQDPQIIIEDKGLRQVSDTTEIEAMIDQVLMEHASHVAEYRSGKDKLFGFFVGQVMKKTQGKANPEVVNQILRAKLSGL